MRAPDQSGVDVTVIVPAYKAGAQLPPLIDALRSQDFAGSYEIVLVVSADTEADLPDVPEHPQLKVITHVPRLSASAARNRGAGIASGRLFAFTDAGARPPRSWLTKLVEASERGSKVVAGAIDNGTRTSLSGTTEYLVEFLDLHPARPDRTAWHGAACNLLIPRSLWQRWGPWPDLQGGEDTLLTSTLKREGLLVFSGAARTTRMNRTGIRTVVGHQNKIGRYTAHIARRGPYKFGALVRHPSLAPVAVAGRFVSTYARVVAWMEGERVRAMLAMPLVIAALISWGAGLFSEGMRLRRHSP